MFKTVIVSWALRCCCLRDNGTSVFGRSAQKCRSSLPVFTFLFSKTLTIISIHRKKRPTIAYHAAAARLGPIRPENRWQTYGGVRRTLYHAPRDAPPQGPSCCAETVDYHISLCAPLRSVDDDYGTSKAQHRKTQPHDHGGEEPSCCYRAPPNRAAGRKGGWKARLMVCGDDRGPWTADDRWFS